MGNVLTLLPVSILNFDFILFGPKSRFTLFGWKGLVVTHRVDEVLVHPRIILAF